MKRLCLIGAVIILLLVMALRLPVHADEPARYNFASAQGEKDLQIAAGEEGQGNIYFYNIDGNRITHITLEVSQVPTGWEVTIEPPISETQLLVSGIPTTITENLYVEPTELLLEEPQDVPEGMVSIKVPGRGYALGKSARIVITVPESAPLGSTEGIKISAEAAWLGQSGAAAIKQTRDFDFTVTVVSTETDYSETIIGTTEEPGTTDSPAVTTTRLDEERLASNNTFMDWLPVIIAVLIVGIFGGILIVRRVSRKRRLS
jgi:hypothetical protein